MTTTYSARLDPVRGGDRLGVDAPAQRHQRVDHRVADLVDRVRVAALGQQVPASLGGVGKEQVRHLVGEHAIDLLGHRPVERPEPCLDVPDRDPELARHQRRGQRRVDVPGHQHQVGLELLDHRLQALHDARRLGRMGA